MTDSTDTSETPLPPDMTVAMAIQRLVAARRQNRLDAESERITGHLDHIRMPYCAQAMARKVDNECALANRLPQRSLWRSRATRRQHRRI